MAGKPQCWYSALLIYPVTFSLYLIISQAVANEVYSLESLHQVLTRSMLSPQHPAVKGSTTPMISIPTTLSSGEYNSYGACTSDMTLNKQIYSNPTHEPRLVVVDSDLALTTPARVWISTGVRAIDHCVQALCSSGLSKEAEANFMQGLQLLIPGLLACIESLVDAEARRKCQLGGMNSMKFMTLKVPLGASHGIGRQLGPYGVPHGETSCVLMPAVAAFNVKANAPQQARILESLWSDETVRDVFEKRGLTPEKASLADTLDVIIRELGMPRDLKSVGVERENLERIAESCVKDPFCKSNPVPLLEKEQVLKILRTVIGEE